jgi:hypothetical protein
MIPQPANAEKLARMLVEIEIPQPKVKTASLTLSAAKILEI